jgi:hypothetical protein
LFPLFEEERSRGATTTTIAVVLVQEHEDERMTLLAVRYNNTSNNKQDNNMQQQQQQHFCFRLDKTDAGAAVAPGAAPATCACGKILYFNPGVNDFNIVDVFEVIRMVAKDDEDMICVRCAKTVFDILPLRWVLMQRAKELEEERRRREGKKKKIKEQKVTAKD